MKIRFWFRKHQTNKKSDLGILYAYVIIEGVQSDDFATGISVKKRNWDNKNQIVVSNPYLNRELENIKGKLFFIKQKFEFENKNYSANDIKNAFIDSVAKKEQSTFLEMFEKYLHYAKTKYKWSKGTLKTNKTRFNNIKEFLIKNNLETVSPDALKIKHLEDFSFQNKNFSLDYIANHLNLIKRVITYCKTQEIIKDSPILTYDVDSENKTDKTSLTPLELEKIESLELKDSLEKVKDIFVFMCYTGLNISDYFIFAKNPKKFLKKKNGKLFIIQNRQKIQARLQNQIFAVIPVLPKVLQLLEKYSYELPIFTDVTVNKYLKRIGKDLGIEPLKMRTKVARKTFANILWNSEMDAKAVSKILGHTKIATTQKYYTDTDIDFISKEIEKFSK